MGSPSATSPWPSAPARIVLEQGRQNVWNVSAEDLSSLMGIEFGDVTPSADTPLVINVLLPEGSEEDASFLFVPPMTGVGAAEAPYILYNVSGAHNLLLGSAGEALPGTVFAPEATVVALLESGLRGNAIAKRFGVFFPEDVVLTEETETVEEFQALEEEATQGEAEEQLEEVERVRNTLYNVPFAAELELCGTEAPDTGSGDGGQDGQDGQETGGGGTTPPPGEGGQDSTPSPTPVADGPKPGDTTDHKDDGGLPVTGASLVGLIAAAVTAVLGGAAALVLARRRRNA
ncbi:LPXTG-motif cell wall-anchored protein [Thermobifida halotolerans]|uniref:collagen-binding domain-containing protein n=1 Tax=Thermobifida halotolerans TaxID=483545 RepID=UPI0035198F1F